MKISSILAILISTLFITSCKEEPTKPSTETNLTLEVLDKSCTEVWIDVKANDQANKLGSVYLNDEFRTQFYLKDTLVYLDELLPNKTYSIKLTNQDGIGTQTEFTTMDTTSHNFTWETFEFGGEGGSSYLRDVAIINENDIWAVGEIFTADTYTYDSSGVFQHPYNAVHWDGNEWELIRIGGYGYPGYHTVYAFNENDVWFDGKIKWDGNSYTAHTNNFPLYPNGDAWTVNGMWGESSSDFYVVGNGGNIAHFNGSSWSKIESGTDLDIQDIYGSKNKGSNKYEILVVASVRFQNNGISFIKINENDTSSRMLTDGLPWSISCLWFRSGAKYFIGGSGLYQNIDLKKSWEIVGGQPSYFINKIRGVELNDIVFCGSNGVLSHYNGKSWKHYMSNELPYINGRYYSVATEGNLMVAVGYKQRSVTIVIGRR